MQIPFIWGVGFYLDRFLRGSGNGLLFGHGTIKGGDPWFEGGFDDACDSFTLQRRSSLDGSTRVCPSGKRSGQDRVSTKRGETWQQFTDTLPWERENPWTTDLNLSRLLAQIGPIPLSVTTVRIPVSHSTCFNVYRVAGFSLAAIGKLFANKKFSISLERIKIQVYEINFKNETAKPFFFC